MRRLSDSLPQVKATGLVGAHRPQETTHGTSPRSAAIGYTAGDLPPSRLCRPAPPAHPTVADGGVAASDGGSMLVDLPDRASHPLVTTVFDVAELDTECGECPRDSWWWPAASAWRITYRYAGTVRFVDVCGSCCGDFALSHLIASTHSQPITEITLHLPAGDAPQAGA